MNFQVNNCRLIFLISLALALAAVAFTTFVSGFSDVVFWRLIRWYDTPASIFMMIILVIGFIHLKWPKHTPWADRTLLHAKSNTLWILLVTWAGLCIASLTLYQNHPLSMDEYSPFFQSKVFASGRLYGTYPVEWLNYLIPIECQNYFLNVNHSTGAVASNYWPGFALLLTPFMFLNIPWACNPTVTVLSLLLIEKITKHLTQSTKAPSWAVLLAISSPVLLVNGISYYSMPSHLLFNLLFVYFFMKKTPKYLVISGLVGGFAMTLHNPVPHIVFALPWIIYSTRKPTNLLWIALGYIPSFGVFGVGWTLFTGSHFSSIPVGGVEGDLSFFNKLFTPIESLLNLMNWPSSYLLLSRVGGIFKHLLWSAPVLPILMFFNPKKGRSHYETLMLISFLATFLCFIFIPFDQGHGWGFRYIHSVWGVVPILGGCFIANSNTDYIPFRNAIFLTSILSLIALSTLRFYQVGEFVKYVTNQHPPVAKTELQVSFHRGVGYYAKDNIQNDPWLRGNTVVFLQPPPEEAQKIVKHFITNPKLYDENFFGSTFVESGNQ